MVERLREAAAIAIERGAPDAALAHLQRAQDEPPAPELRSALTLELGAAAEFVRGTAAAEALAQAHAGLTDPVARATAAIMLARTLLFMEDPAEAMDVVDAPAPSCRPSTRTCTWRCARSGSWACSSASPTRRTWPSSRPGGRGPRGQGPGAKTLTAITALAVAV